MPAAAMPLHVRFEAKVSPEPTSGCHLWTGALSNRGYGWIGMRDPDGAWRPKLAHRVAWMLRFGWLPDDDQVLAHRCDNRTCVNPDHLFVTDNAGNMADMVAKDRQARGERSARHRLTDQEVEAIRQAYRTCRNQYDVAEAFGITQQHVSQIVRFTSRARQTRAGTRAGAA